MKTHKNCVTGLYNGSKLCSLWVTKALKTQLTISLLWDTWREENILLNKRWVQETQWSPLLREKYKKCDIGKEVRERVDLNATSLSLSLSLSLSHTHTHTHTQQQVVIASKVHWKFSWLTGTGKKYEVITQQTCQKYYSLRKFPNLVLSFWSSDMNLNKSETILMCEPLRKYQYLR